VSHQRDVFRVVGGASVPSRWFGRLTATWPFAVLTAHRLANGMLKFESCVLEGDTDLARSVLDDGCPWVSPSVYFATCLEIAGSPVTLIANSVKIDRSPLKISTH
jgi:hypothetical protein